MVKLWDDVVVQSYKHDKSLHRIWANATVIDHDENVIKLANYRTKVIEANGRFWYTKEPSVTWFYKNKWYNIIGILRPTGIFYYCNIASPYILDDEALKYIDYDLDIKVAPDLSYTVLDRKEYNRHKENMDYPEKLRDILETELSDLKKLIEEKKGPFEPGAVQAYYDVYCKEILDKE